MSAYCFFFYFLFFEQDVLAQSLDFCLVKHAFFKCQTVLCCKPCSGLTCQHFHGQDKLQRLPPPLTWAMHCAIGAAVSSPLEILQIHLMWCHPETQALNKMAFELGKTFMWKPILTTWTFQLSSWNMLRKNGLSNHFPWWHSHKTFIQLIFSDCILTAKFLATVYCMHIAG